MIPKIWCWLFGHVIRFKGYTKEDRKANLEDTFMNYYHWVKYTYCPRCGAKL